MIRFSGSGSRRLIHCPPSAAMSKVQRKNEYSSFGDAVHKFLEECNLLGRPAAVAKWANHPLCDAVTDVNHFKLPIDNKSYAPEVAFAYDFSTRTARELGRGIGREYVGLSSTENPGTADVVGMTEDGNGVFVGDYKTGWDPHHLVPPAEENEQLAYLALCATKAYGKEYAIVEIIRVRDGEDPFHDTAILDAFSLLDFEKRITAAWRKAIEVEANVQRGEPVELHEGDWCRWCPSFDVCPAKTQMLRVMVSNGMQLPAITSENAEMVKERADMIMMIAEKVKADVKEYAIEHPFRMKNGMTYGPALKRFYVPDANAEDFLLEKLGKDIVDRAFVTTREMTWASLKKAVSAAGKEKPAKLIKQLKQQMVESGAAHTKDTYPVRAHRPGKEDEED